jgi:hypothetical protein
MFLFRSFMLLFIFLGTILAWIEVFFLKCAKDKLESSVIFVTFLVLRIFIFRFF